MDQEYSIFDKDSKHSNPIISISNPRDLFLYHIYIKYCYALPTFKVVRSCRSNFIYFLEKYEVSINS